MSRFESVGEARAELRPMSGGIEVLIPAHRSRVALLFLAVWLVGWGLGEWEVLSDLLSPSGEHGQGGFDGFMVLWFLAWTGFGLFILYAILWMGFGHEIARFADDEVSLRNALFGFGRCRRYDPREVNHLRVIEGVSSLPFQSFMPRFPGSSFGETLAFDYGAKTLRFGSGVEVAEARRIRRQILAVAPALGAES